MSKIIGATVGTTSPRPDWNQTDPKKADYIKNKPEGAGGGSGTDGITPHIGANGNWWIGDTDTGVKAAGTNGSNGADGVSPTVTVTSITGGHRITITDKNGTKTVDVMDGTDGSNGKDGAAGKDGRGIKTVARTSGTGAAGTTDTYTITYTDNTTSTFTVYNGKDGQSGSNGNDGADGQRGTGILKVSTTPTSYTTATNGINPIKRMSISTIKNEAGVSEVLVGDCICHSYYLYHIYYLDSTYAYMDKSQSIRGATGGTGAAGADGKDGTSVTVSGVSESAVDGGSNVVTFSDGTTLTIKNGNKGGAVLSATDKQEIKNEVIASIITQGSGESESLVMSQKAVTDLVADALGGGGGGGTSAEYETVDSVDKMTDTSKQYVYNGTLWTYGEVTEEVNVNEQIFDASKAFTGHMSGVNISSSSNKMYPLPVDTSKIPEDVIAYVEVNGFYIRSTTSPYLEKVGYSALESPKQANSQLIECWYAQGATTASYLDADEIFATSTGIKIKVGYEKGSKHISYDTIKTLLLEVPSAQTHDASTIKAYLQYSYTGTVAKWYDTGLAPSTGGGGGGNYVELLVKVNKNTTDIYEVGKRVTALETGSDSLTVPTYWQSAVDACISKIKALQVGRNCVTFPFFSDNHQRNGYAGVLIAHIMKECNIPYCFFGGDSISNGQIADEATMIAQDKAFDTMMSYVPNGRVCRAVGNHDGYWYDGTNKYWYNRDQVYDLFLREESIAQNKHFGGEGTYYYVDDIASKVRWIVMDTNNAPVDDTQIAWVQNTALSFSESGWAVVFISHQPISNHYHAGITNAAAVVSAVTSKATANNVPIIGWYSGHVHRDILATKLMSGGNSSNAGTEGASLGFTQVIITSDHTGIAYDDATKHTVANDDQSHAIDFVTINKATRTVNITRLGIGSDRSYTY